MYPTRTLCHRVNSQTNGSLHFDTPVVRESKGEGRRNICKAITVSRRLFRFCYFRESREPLVRPCVLEIEPETDEGLSVLRGPNDISRLFRLQSPRVLFRGGDLNPNVPALSISARLPVRYLHHQGELYLISR